MTPFRLFPIAVAVAGTLTGFVAFAQERVPSEARTPALEKLPIPRRGESSYAPVTVENFDEVYKKMSAAKSKTMQRARALLEERYDLANRPARGVTMSRGKAGAGRRARQAARRA